VEPDGKSLEVFLSQARAVDPLRFPELSLAVIKLLGAGEYSLGVPGGDSAGHFLFRFYGDPSVSSQHVVFYDHAYLNFLIVHIAFRITLANLT
jgi:hypothetical protein